MNARFEIRYTLSVSVIAIFFWIVFSNFTRNNKEAETPNLIKHHLAFSINPTQSTNIIIYAIVAVRDNQIIGRKFIDATTFLLYGTGKIQSSANPDRINYFDQYKLSDCFYKYDSIQDEYFECFTLKDLWTLRYSQNPICPEDCTPIPGMRLKGWSQGKFHPSWPQIQILQKYGVIHDSDFFYGENMFKLFQDMENPEWIEQYKTAQ